MSNVQVIAHRGASRAERENTLEAFRRAGLMGADAVELDVRRTA
ncbi:MAG: Glycerophosphoryl diester phosphodiesterase family, partial [Actinomycetota bacterium]